MVDKPVADWLFNIYLILKQVTYTQTIEVSSTTDIGAQRIENIGSVYLVDASSAAVTITLPLAADSQNVLFTIKKIDSSGNAVTIDANEDVDGGTLSLASQYDVKTVVSNGTEWFSI
ncbi:MAG: hypothetical protein KDD13_00310 [Mangrovimonas sp.]|nr:hypothetical protein [Mangrovimonas sp.]